MNRRTFFNFLPIAPVGMVMAAEAMAKAPPVSMAPDKALMTLSAHKPPPSPPPPPKYPIFQSGSVIITGKDEVEWCKNNFITVGQPVTNKLVVGNGMEIQADHDFDKTTKVSMSVGKDGHLWLKINDEWKRIVTE